MSLPAILLGLVSIILVAAPIGPYTDAVTTFLVQWGSKPYDPSQITVTQDWAMMNLESAVKVAAAYLLLVSIGLFMRKPGEEEGSVSPLVDKPVKALQGIYNLVQCILCGYMIFRAIEHYRNHSYAPICNPFDLKESGMASALHIFYLSKILDFCDTLFIVLRQKWRQMSFLHIYHHTSIFLVYWLNTRVAYDGDIYLTVVLNSFVHLVMYSYYFLSTLGYSAWWKNYITLLQMGQFLIMNAQAIYILAVGCPFPHNITWMYLFYIISLFLLFQNFYQRTYKKRPTDKKPVQKKVQ